MLGKLILLFVGLPLIELALLIKVGTVVGAAATILLVVLTGVLGATLARRQGLRTYMRIQEELHAGRLPGNEMMDGLLILIGGIVLLTPGLLTDLLGFSLLVPAFRRAVRQFLRKRMVVIAKQHRQGPHVVIDV